MLKIHTLPASGGDTVSDLHESLDALISHNFAALDFRIRSVRSPLTSDEGISRGSYGYP